MSVFVSLSLSLSYTHTDTKVLRQPLSRSLAPCRELVVTHGLVRCQLLRNAFPVAQEMRSERDPPLPAPDSEHICKSALSQVGNLWVWHQTERGFEEEGWKERERMFEMSWLEFISPGKFSIQSFWMRVERFKAGFYLWWQWKRRFKKGHCQRSRSVWHFQIIKSVLLSLMCHSKQQTDPT